MKYKILALTEPSFSEKEVEADELGFWLHIATIQIDRPLKDGEKEKILKAFEAKKMQIGERLFGTVKKFKLIPSMVRQ